MWPGGRGLIRWWSRTAIFPGRRCWAMTIRSKKANHSSLHQLFRSVIFLLTLACAGLASRDIAAEIQSARAERRVTRRTIENFTPIDQNGPPFAINNLAGSDGRG